MKKVLRTKGFTLVETLVAVTIFTVSLTALVAVTSRGVFDTNFSKNKITATYLAQEGIELVRNIRDSRSIQGADFISISGELCSGGDCQIEIEPLDPYGGVYDCGDAGQLDPDSGCSFLLYDELSGFYTYAVSPGVESSIFSRRISLEPVAEGQGLVVRSEVFWRQGDSLRDVAYTEVLYDWIDSN
jgi:prepilin-type N-terminal cleavage/methylation domain-containing protein